MILRQTLLKARVLRKQDFTGGAIPSASLGAIEASYNQINQILKIRAEMQ